MGRTYAGILGPLALIVTIIRGFRYAAGVESTLLTATLYLLAFAAIGHVLGSLAEWIVDDSVRSKVAAEVAAMENQETSQPEPATA